MNEYLVELNKECIKCCKLNLTCVGHSIKYDKKLECFLAGPEEGKIKKNKHEGSSFDDFLEEENLLKEVTTQALKRSNSLTFKIISKRIDIIVNHVKYLRDNVDHQHAGITSKFSTVLVMLLGIKVISNIEELKIPTKTPIIINNINQCERINCIGMVNNVGQCNICNSNNKRPSSINTCILKCSHPECSNRTPERFNCLI